MNINTNLWNKIRYTLYAPGYDIAGKILNGSRKKSIDNLHISATDKVLIVGAGTGLDLDFLHSQCQITATDITPAMIEKVKKRNSKLKLNLDARVMDGQSLKFDNNTFDYVLLHLIVSVIPDPIACIKEAERVLKIGGKIALFDKFVRKNNKASLLRRVANIFTNTMFSDITRNFESIAAHTTLNIISDEDADLNGNFRLIQLSKN